MASYPQSCPEKIIANPLATCSIGNAIDDLDTPFELKEEDFNWFLIVVNAFGKKEVCN